MSISRVKIEQFCGLSTNAHWQSWLYKYDIVLYQQLIDHLRISKGCGHNREKMIELMEQIESRPGGREAILEFLRTSFPAMLEWDQQSVSVAVPSAIPGVVIPEVPFEWNGSQLTFPRRAILQHDDPNVLRENLRQLVGDKVRSEHITIGNRVYVEYVPVGHAKILNQIPEKNWRVPAFKRLRGLL